MQIEILDFTNKNGKKAVFGINVSEIKNRKNVHLFDLKENKEDLKLSDSVWGVSQQVLDRKFSNKLKRNDVQWTYTTGHRTTSINFGEINNQPQSLLLSDDWVFELEGSLLSYDLAKYEQHYRLENGRLVLLDDEEESIMDKRQNFILATPCAAAKDGVFYCKPDNFSDYGFQMVLSDTKKLVSHVELHFPSMMEHAVRKHGNETPEQYLKYNSYRNNYNTGSFVIKNSETQPSQKGLTMSTGDAGMLILAQEMALPFVPITISAYDNQDKWFAVKDKIAYTP